MKKIAIIERLENSGKDKPFNIVYYLDSSYRKIFDKLNILLISVISEKNIEEISKSIGKNNKAVIGIKDINFANSIQKKYNGGDVIG